MQQSVTAQFSFGGCGENIFNNEIKIRTFFSTLLGFNSDFGETIEALSIQKKNSRFEYWISVYNFFS